MKSRIRIACATLILGFFPVSNLFSDAGPFDGKNFRGRIAYSADGNHNDPDDWAASPVALALFAEFGVKEKLVHFDYNSILNNTDTQWEKTHEASVLSAAERYGYDRRLFHDCRQDVDAAVASITKAVNGSTAENPLYFIVAGPMQVAVMGILKSSPEARKHVYVISHSHWNDGLVTRYSFKNTKRDVIALGVNWIQIRDQNPLLAFSRYGQPAQPEEFEPYFWMRDSQDSKVRFLWERMVVSTRPDTSDSGMAYFLLTGDEEADLAKYRRLLDEKVVPSPVDVRSKVRIEAENFITLDGYELEITDRAASHRVGIKLTEGADAGRVRTNFSQPYTAAQGLYNVEVRYFDEQGPRSRFALFVNGAAQGSVWESAGTGQGWTSHTIRDVKVSAGDEIGVDVSGPPARLDYVQLDLRSRSEADTWKVGIAQIGTEDRLSENLAKILLFIRKGAAEGCRVVVFPEGALSGASTNEPAETEQALAEIRKAAASGGIYVVLGGKSSRPERRPQNWMVAVDPAGQEILRYDKLYDKPTAGMPHVFSIDGSASSAIICADRWLRGVEELPIMNGAEISFELSDNFESEWVPALGWYWYVPRALRNGVYVLFANTAGRGRHGHSAVIGPDGAVIAAAAGNAEELVTAIIDPAKASRAEATRRRQHPLLATFWKEGLKILTGGSDKREPLEPYTSPEVEIKLAVAQMACSSKLSENVEKMAAMIREAAAQGADVAVFPELAVTGAREEDVLRADERTLTRALEQVREAARSAGIYTVFGMPYYVGRKRTNAAFVVGPDGAILTRYDQLAVDRPRLFTAGSEAGAMWFRLKGVPAVVTVGREGLWNEIAEMTSLAGAQLRFHVSYDLSTGEQASLRRLQIWANLASYGTFTATVNAASPEGLRLPSAPAEGGSALWEDLQPRVESNLALKGEKREGHESLAIYSPFSANCVVRAGQHEQLLYSTQRVNRNNQHRSVRFNPAMAPWYALGARLFAARPEF